MRSRSHGLRRLAPRRIFGRRAHRKLVHVCAAKKHRARLAQLGDDRRIVRRDVALQNFRSARARIALHVDHVLDRDGHAAERLAHVRRVGFRARLVGVDVIVRFELRINLGNARVELIDNFARLHRAALQFLADFRNGQAGHGERWREARASFDDARDDKEIIFLRGCVGQRLVHGQARHQFVGAQLVLQVSLARSETCETSTSLS